MAVRITFNGADQYATMAAYSALGNKARYSTLITFTTNNPSGAVINPNQPITEFGRVWNGSGYDYHDGYLKDLRITDTSPLHGTNCFEAAGSGQGITFPDLVIRDGWIQFDMAFTDTRDQTILSNGDDENILSIDTLKMVAGGSVSSITWDGVAYADEDLVADRHYRIKVNISGSIVLRRMVGWCKYGNLVYYSD